MTSLVSRLEITAIALALASGLLYVHGMAFHRAYLASFGLSAESFPSSADQTIMRGFEGYIFMASLGTIQLVSVSSLVVIGAFLAIIVIAVLADRVKAFLADLLLKRAWIRSLFFYAPGDEPKAPQVFADTAFSALRCLGVGVIAFLFFVFTAAFLAKSGRYKAELVREACGVATPQTAAQSAWGTSAAAVLVQYEQPGASTLAQINGCIIAATPEFIAVYDKSGTVTIPIARVVAIRAPTK